MANTTFPVGIPEIIADYCATYELTQEAREHQDEIDDWFEGFANNSRGCDRLLNFIKKFGHELCLSTTQTMWECLLNNPCAGDIFDEYPDKFQINLVKTLHPWSERLMRSRLHELTDWSNISHMPEMVDILHENQDKLIFAELVKNSGALDLIRLHMDSIQKDHNASHNLCMEPWGLHVFVDRYNGYSEILSRHVEATNMIIQKILEQDQFIIRRNNDMIEFGEELTSEEINERGSDMFDWSYINNGGNMLLLNQYPDRIDLESLTWASSPGAVAYIRDRVNCLSESEWDNVNRNPAMVNILIENPTKINRRYGIKHIRRARFVHFRDCDWGSVSDIEEIFEARRSEEVLAALYALESSRHI